MNSDAISPALSPRLTSLQVTGLLDRFDYHLSFPAEWDFLILHGPNGIGKTRLLELLNVVFSGSHVELPEIPFREARFGFDNGAWIEVRRDTQTQERLPGLQVRIDGEPAPEVASLTWSGGDGETIEVREQSVRLTSLQEWERMALRYERDYPVEYIGRERWLDLRTREELDRHQFSERYGIDLPTTGEPPVQIRERIQEHSVHLIDTQRILSNQESRTPRQRRREREPRQTPRVVRYAEDLVWKLSSALAENSRRSQEFDRSFPRRLFENSSDEPPTEESILARYFDQLKLRDRLATVSILEDSSADLSLTQRPLDVWERRVLGTYLDDADEKLATFEPLLKRVELLSEIVNQRFLFKRFEIDRYEGFRFIDVDSDRNLSPSALSSGEQHELVLAYDLLMNVKTQSLVLIDEPEISLHVAWQKEFLNDIARIAELTQLRFIIATHSPQIIGPWWERAIELYSVP